MNRNNKVIIESPLGSGLITIITYNNLRYIIEGDKETIPDSNYVLLDISEIPELGDEIGICWEVENLKWRVVNYNAKVIENKLSVIDFEYQEDTDRTKIGVPTMINYMNDNCIRAELYDNIWVRLGLDNGYQIDAINGKFIENN
ncbi:MAG: hypothetical protein JJ971_13470 [Balneolaceae bacterium]|nr:hypothetical protein [Balneolaceae bacterium]MBO6547134.1 hypothetical protein [Balneolaceae bacterium]MBO6647918.1 hypothetical protein [Balneolaceae bacterium]